MSHDSRQTGTSGAPLSVADYYCTDFKYKGAGFCVTAQNGVTREYLIHILKQGFGNVTLKKAAEIDLQRWERN